MRKVILTFVIACIFGGMLWAAGFLRTAGVMPFLLSLADGRVSAGIWNDDPENWQRAFNGDLPTGAIVVHSRYWRSDHFTLEFAYYFEVKASPGWRDAFLQKHQFQLEPPTEARAFGSNGSPVAAPPWFAPYPASFYEVWQRPGLGGRLWIEKSTGHLFFYEEQV